VALPADEQRQRLFGAAARLLRLGGKPLLLLADDIQWCDHETLRFIHYLLRTEPNAPILVAATARSEEMDGRGPLLDLVRALRQLGVLVELSLDRLTREATGDLASALSARPLGSDETEVLFRETAGNPLFVVESVRAGWQSGDRSRGGPSAKVQNVIASRLDGLSAEARTVLETAAAIGRDFTLDVITPAAGLSADAVAHALDELWKRRLVREHDPGVYDFSHDKIRDVAYRALTPPRRRLLHRKAAETLARARGHTTDTVSGQVAAHYDRAGEIDQAITWYEAAAEASQKLCASAEAVRLLTRALELLERLPATPERGSRELAMLTSLLVPVSSVEGFASSRLGAIQARIVELARELRVEVPAEVLRSQAIISLIRDDFAAARGYGERLRARGLADRDDALQVEGEYVLGIACFWKGELEAARSHFERAVREYRAERRQAHVLRYALDPQVICLSRLGNTLWFLGDTAGAYRARDDALALAARIGHEPSRRVALVFSALLSIELDELDRLREDVAELEAGDAELDLLPSRLNRRVYRAYLRARDGDVEGGIATIRAALEELGGPGHAPGQRAAMARVLLAAHDTAGNAAAKLDAAERLVAMGGAASLWEAEAHRVRAEALAELGASVPQVVAALDRAIAVARRQGARAIERRAQALLHRCRPSAEDGPAPAARA
jgi:tetratricopeptide (TPR) repeat protein